MGIRGRRSSASMTVVSGGALIPRPPPPSDLTDEQSVEWRAIVSRLAADWFPRETFPLLAQYCRHIVAARKVADLIRAAEADSDTSIGDYDKLLGMQEREGRAISSLATRMRLTQHATYDAKKTKPSITLGNPWDDEAAKDENAG